MKQVSYTGTIHKPTYTSSFMNLLLICLFQTLTLLVSAKLPKQELMVNDNAKSKANMTTVYFFIN